MAKINFSCVKDYVKEDVKEKKNDSMLKRATDIFEKANLRFYKKEDQELLVAEARIEIALEMLRERIEEYMKLKELYKEDALKFKENPYTAETIQKFY